MSLDFELKVMLILLWVELYIYIYIWQHIHFLCIGLILDTIGVNKVDLKNNAN